MALLLIGLNHHTSPLAFREKFYLSSDKLIEALESLQAKSAIEESAILSTCNRFELYIACNHEASAEADVLDFLSQYYAIPSDELRPYLYLRYGRCASEHLMKVASGLESLVLGESQILGQVAHALDCAATVQATGVYLHRLFEAAIHAGKRARNETSISQHSTSVSHAAAILLHKEIGVKNPKILILGAGEMAELAVYALHKYGYRQIFVLNRTFSRGKALADKFGVEAREWSKLWDEMKDADAVISATGAEGLILHADELRAAALEKPVVLIDVAVPRDIDPEAANIHGVQHYDIDALRGIVDENLALRQAAVPDVELIIAEESERFTAWINERNIVPVIRDLRREVSSLIEAELHEALNKLPELNEAEQAILKRMAHRITNKVLHTPMNSLREHAASGNGTEFAQVVRELFALE